MWHVWRKSAWTSEWWKRWVTRPSQNLEFTKHKITGASSKQALASSCTWHVGNSDPIFKERPGWTGLVCCRMEPDLQTFKQSGILKFRRLRIYCNLQGSDPKRLYHHKTNWEYSCILYIYIHIICIAIYYDSKQTSSTGSSFYCRAHQVVTCPNATRSTVSRPETLVVLEPALDNTTGEVDLVMSESSGQFVLKQTYKIDSNNNNNNKQHLLLSEKTTLPFWTTNQNGCIPQLRFQLATSKGLNSPLPGSNLSSTNAPSSERKNHGGLLLRKSFQCLRSTVLFGGFAYMHCLPFYWNMLKFAWISFGGGSFRKHFDWIYSKWIFDVVISSDSDCKKATRRFPVLGHSTI